MSTNLQHWRTRTPENRRPMFRRSPLLAAERVRSAAADVFCKTFGNRPAKQLRPLLNAQDVHELRHRGGALGKTAVLMLADPANALVYAEHLMSVARAVAGHACRPLDVVLSEEVRADVEEDVAQDDLRVKKSPETLRTYIEKAKRARAILADAIDSAERELEELESGQ